MSVLKERKKSNKGLKKSSDLCFLAVIRLSEVDKETGVFLLAAL